MSLNKVTIVGIGLAVVALFASLLFWSKQDQTLAAQEPAVTTAVTQSTNTHPQTAQEAAPQAQTAPQSSLTAVNNTDLWVESTDPAVIRLLLQQLAAQQTAVWHGQSGWFNVRLTSPNSALDSSTASDYSGPQGQLVPAEALFPTGSGYHSRWYYLETDGRISQGLTFSADAQGNLYQPTVLQGDRWHNQTLAAHDINSSTAVASHDLAHYLPIADVVAFLDVALNSPTDVVTVHSYRADGRYHLVVTSTYAAAADLGPTFPEPVVGSERHFTFAQTDGQLLSDEHRFLLQSGALFVAGQTDYTLSANLQAELPTDVATLWQQAQTK